MYLPRYTTNLRDVFRCDCEVLDASMPHSYHGKYLHRVHVLGRCSTLAAR